MSSTGTRDFLNGLRIAGRLWGSHGDKITYAAHGRNYDDERAAKTIEEFQATTMSAVTGAGLEDQSRGNGSPSIMRQVSRDLVISPSSPFIARQSSSPTSNWGENGNPSFIMRQTSLDFVPSGASGVSSPPPLIARQSSRDMPLSEILRQHSRELSPTSPTYIDQNLNANFDDAAVFRPIGGSQSGNSKLSQSPTSLLTPFTSSSPMASPKALRPSGRRSPLAHSLSYEYTRIDEKGLSRCVEASLAPPRETNHQIGTSLPNPIVKEHSKLMGIHDYEPYRSKHTAAKAILNAVQPSEYDGTETRLNPIAALSAADKADLINEARTRDRVTNVSKVSVFSRKKSLGRRSTSERVQENSKDTETRGQQSDSSKGNIFSRKTSFGRRSTSERWKGNNGDTEKCDERSDCSTSNEFNRKKSSGRKSTDDTSMAGQVEIDFGAVKWRPGLILSRLIRKSSSLQIS